MNTGRHSVIPICAICQKQVDRFSSLRNPDGTTTYTATCHGETESVTLSNMDIVQAIDIEIGTAFTAALHGGQSIPMNQNGTEGAGKA